MRNIIAYPIDTNDVKQALESSIATMDKSGAIGSVHPYALHLLVQYLNDKQEELQHFLTITQEREFNDL